MTWWYFPWSTNLCGVNMHTATILKWEILWTVNNLSRKCCSIKHLTTLKCSIARIILFFFQRRRGLTLHMKSSSKQSASAWKCNKLMRWMRNCISIISRYSFSPIQSTYMDIFLLDSCIQQISMSLVSMIKCSKNASVCTSKRSMHVFFSLFILPFLPC